MGQKVEIRESVVLGDVAVFDTDRSFTGQEGELYRSSRDAAAREGSAARLAEALFDGDDQLTSVYVFSNAVSVGRLDEWNEEALNRTRAAVESLFLFYR